MYKWFKSKGKERSPQFWFTWIVIAHVIGGLLGAVLFWIFGGG